MKKLLLAFVLLAFISTDVFAQKLRFGAQAGVALASIKAKDDGVSLTSDGKAGFTAGVLADIACTDQFAFQPALNFIQKGGKIKYSSSGFSAEEKQTLNYLELLLNFLYRSDAGNGKFFVGLGPDLSLGMSGKYTYKESGQPDEKGDIDFGNDKDNDHYKSLEIGGNILTGYEFSNGLFVAVNYNTGLNNIDVDEGDDNVKNRYFGIRIGYILSQLMKK